MSTRNKLVLFSVGAIVVAVTAIGLIASWQFSSYAQLCDDFARQSLEKQAVLEVQRIDTVLAQFVSNGRRGAERLAKAPLLHGAENKFTRYTETTSPTELLYDEHNPYEQQVYKLFMEARNVDPALGLIFMGTIDGGFALAPEKDTLGAGYDPRKRPWYIEALENPADINVSKVYTSSSRALVTSITSRIKTPQGKLVGVLSLDLDLSMLTSYIKGLKIGEGGYAMVFDKDGTLLVDPKDNPNSPQTFFKKIGPDVLSSLAPVAEKNSGFTTVERNGREMDVTIYTSESLGWKIATLIPTKKVQRASEEVRRTSANMVFIIISLGVGICIVCGIVMLLVARSITRPIDKVVDAAGAIAAGDFKALPPARYFSGEMLRLHSSLDAMVSELGQLVSTAETKSEEAKEQSKRAAEAVAEAEKARRDAEQAQRAGMLQAACQLEDIVGQTRRAAEDMKQHISRAALGAQMQNKHSDETTIAMGEMNATSMERARSSMQAAETAQETTGKAESGVHSVHAVKQAIGEVAQKAESLKSVINNLGEQAHGINQIITVINDIADQTNLLALNAAIEAARAGEYGRSFAVVADEVRKLAEKTMIATKEVGDSIKSIQAGTMESVQGMDDAAGSVARSTELASQAEDALREILSLSTVTADQVQSIAAAGEQQSAASAKVRRITDAISQIAGETVESMDSANAAVAALNELTHKLEELITGLKNS